MSDEAPGQVQAVDLQIGGMTCASCAARVEKSLNHLDGVDATVNYATELAAIRYDPDRVSLSELVRAVEMCDGVLRH